MLSTGKDQCLLKERKFIIIGGGIAGLAAANKLVKSGRKDVVILEAKNRLGGRIHTVKQGGKPLELGAQWIHGEEGNALCDLARNNGYLFDFTSGKTKIKFWLDIEENGIDEFKDQPNFCMSDGSRVPVGLIRGVVCKINNILHEALKYFREHASEEKREKFHHLLLKEFQNYITMCQDNHIQPVASSYECADENTTCKQSRQEIIDSSEKEDMSVAAFIGRHAEDVFNSVEDEKTKEIMLGILDWRLCMEKIDYSFSSLDEIPLSNWGEFHPCPGDENVELGKDGFQPIVDYFAKEIPESCIRLNSVVKRIVWNGTDGLEDDTQNNAEGVAENTPSSSENKAAIGISGSPKTSSPSSNGSNKCERAHSRSFDEFGKIEVCLESGEIFLADYVLVTLPLGVLKYHCIQNKDEQFFVPRLPKSKLVAIEKLAYGNMDKIYLEFESPFWKDDELGFQFIWKRGEVVELECLGKWGRCYNDARWYRAIPCFTGLLQHPNFLCGWIAGADAIEMEKEDDQFVLEVCRELLVKFSGLKSEEIGIPKRLIRTRWHHDPYSRGCYSYRSFGSSVESSLDLAQPLPSEENPRLFFAGEATHSIFFSTVHGAMLTGFNQACNMLKHSQE